MDQAHKDSTEVNSRRLLDIECHPGLKNTSCFARGLEQNIKFATLVPAQVPGGRGFEQVPVGRGFEQVPADRGFDLLAFARAELWGSESF